MFFPRLARCLVVGAALLPTRVHGQMSPPFPRVEWNPSTVTLVQRDASYARIIRLADRRLVCGYELGRKVWLRHSVDNGKTWRDPILVASPSVGYLSNTDLLQLHNGPLLYFYNLRPTGPNRPPARMPDGTPARFSICMSRSIDGGQTWQPAVTLFQAGSDWGTGCWEPAGVELPSGEIDVFFANEAPYVRTDEQEISLLRSLDGGRTWTTPQAVSFRAGSRDGMPAPLLLRNEATSVFAIEDNGLSGGTFKPVIIASGPQSDWRGGPVNAASPRRWSALAQPLPPDTYAGAPNLRQLHTGETLLSFQQGESNTYLRSSRLAVCIGDAHARNFGAPSYPFPVVPGVGQLWNGLFVKDAQTITAISATSINGTRGVWTIDGRVIRNASSSPP